MSVRMMGQVWDLSLDPPEKLVLLAFADHADDEGHCFPSLARVAWKTGYSVRQLQRVVVALRHRGLLEPLQFDSGGRGRATVYRVNPTKGDKMSPFQATNPDNLSSFTPDKMSPFADQKGDICAERVTSTTVKGDIGVTPTISNHHLNHQKELHGARASSPTAEVIPDGNTPDNLPPELTPEARDTLAGMLRGAHRPPELLAEVRMVLAGNRPNVPRDPVAVSQAITDLALIGDRVTGRMLRIFVQRAAQDLATPSATTRPSRPGPHVPGSAVAGFLARNDPQPRKAS